MTKYILRRFAGVIAALALLCAAFTWAGVPRPWNFWAPWVAVFLWHVATMADRFAGRLMRRGDRS